MGIETALIAGAVATGGAAIMDNKNQKKAIASQEQQKADSQAFIERQMEKTRGELFKLFPSAQDSQQKGLAAGLNLYSQSVPMQLNAFKAGNMGAQQTIAGALPQIQNAILGRRTDLSGLQPRAVDVGQFNVPQAPQFQQINELMQQPQQQNVGGLLAQIPPEVLAALAAQGIR